MNKFENVDVIASLQAVMKQNTTHYHNRRLLCENAIWDWYNRNKVPVRVAREA